jgi:predicted nuclease of restriction endonuclease-like (RecB) superfamily
MKKILTNAEIKLFENDEADKDAIQNFLGTLPSHTSLVDDYRNLKIDARLYGWNVATIEAIADGIDKAHNQ